MTGPQPVLRERVFSILDHRLPYGKQKPEIIETCKQHVGHTASVFSIKLIDIVQGLGVFPHLREVLCGRLAYLCPYSIIPLRLPTEVGSKRESEERRPHNIANRHEEAEIPPQYSQRDDAILA